MTTLSDHWNEGGKWLKEGWHTVTVKEYRLFEYNSGSPGVEFQVEDAAGSLAKLSHVLIEKCFWTLAGFAQACGMTREECAKYDPETPDNHRMLVGKTVQVLVVPDGKYHKVAEWAEAGTRQQDPPPQTQRVEPVKTPLDDVPF